MAENGRKLSELRVCDLKAELEKRKLDTVGPKAALLERLEKALKNEGIEPSKHVFNSPNNRKKSMDTPMKKVKEPETNVVIKEEPVECAEEEEELEEGINDENGDYEIDQVGDVDDECYIIENEMNNEYEEENDDEEMAEEENCEEENGEEENGEEENGHEEVSREDDECENGDDADEDVEEDDTDANNHDNDESINLTIGEDEQKLLHDEAPDDKEKTAEVNGISKEKAAGGASKEKAEKSSSIKKAEKKSSGINKSGVNVKDKEKEKDKNTSLNMKTKGKDEKHANEKKETSEVKSSSSSKTAQKDDKEKSSSKNTAGEQTSTSTTITGNAATNLTSATSGNNVTTAKSTTSTSSKNASTSRNLWVSGLAAITRASDLKTIFSKYGKVIGAKVVTNTRTPGHRCYGYVTMSSTADANRCIEHLHRTELHGRIISVERTKNEIGSSGTSAATSTPNPKENSKPDTNRREEEKSKLNPAPKERREPRRADGKHKGTEAGHIKVKTEDSSNKDRKREPNEKDEKSKLSKDAGGGKFIRRRSPKKFHGPLNRPRITSRDREQRQREREREQRERVRQREILTYQKIREERERQRLRERERELREEERRRREFRERQRQEEQRLAEERRKLAQERERLEREKAELLRLERERQKLEREKLELERLELKRQQMKIIHSRDDTLKPRHGKRSSTDRYNDAPERKRVPAESRFEIPPPPRFDASLVNPRGSKRDDYVSSSSAGGKRHDSHDFSSSVKPRGGGDYSKRDDYGASSGVVVSKRSAIDDYSSSSAKRTSGGDFLKRSGADYVSSSKRGIGSHREDFGSSKPSARDADIRHIPVTTSGGGSGSYHKSSGGGRYGESERGSGTSGFRRGMDDIRSTGGKRFESSSGYGSSSLAGSGSGGNSNLWNGPSGGHIGHGSSNSGGPTLKSYVSNGMGSSGMHGSSWSKPVSMEDNSWRPVPSQDRYDRTYNERSSGYPNSGSSNLYSTSNGRSAPDRYGAPVRY